MPEDFTTDPSYKEILVLDKMLTSSGIPHTLKRFFDGWQVCYPAEDDRVMDAIEHSGSYGNEKDLLEIMGLLTPEEQKHGSVLGYLTAQKVFERIERDWKGRPDYTECRDRMDG